MIFLRIFSVLVSFVISLKAMDNKEFSILEEKPFLYKWYWREFDKENQPWHDSFRENGRGYRFFVTVPGTWEVDKANVRQYFQLVTPWGVDFKESESFLEIQIGSYEGALEDVIGSSEQNINPNLGEIEWSSELQTDDERSIYAFSKKDDQSKCFKTDFYIPFKEGNQKIFFGQFYTKMKDEKLFETYRSASEAILQSIKISLGNEDIDFTTKDYLNSLKERGILKALSSCKKAYKKSVLEYKSRTD